MFAVAAVLLAILGLYGAVSYQVAQRTREIGVRMALGATRTEVAGMRGARATAPGVAFGIKVAAGLERLMAAAVPDLEGLNVAAVSDRGIDLTDHCTARQRSTYRGSGRSGPADCTT